MCFIVKQLFASMFHILIVYFKLINHLVASIVGCLFFYSYYVCATGCYECAEGTTC